MISADLKVALSSGANYADFQKIILSTYTDGDLFDYNFGKPVDRLLLQEILTGLNLVSSLN